MTINANDTQVCLFGRDAHSKQANMQRQHGKHIHPYNFLILIFTQTKLDHFEGRADGPTYAQNNKPQQSPINPRITRR